MASDNRLYPILALNASSSEAESKKVYDDWAATYEEDIRIHGYKGPQLCVDAFDKAMQSADVFPDAHKEIKILDVGAGTGIVGEMLVERGFTNVDGLDISQEMLNFALSKNVYRQVVCAPLSEKAIEEIQTAEYDVVLCAGTIANGQVKPGAIDECIRFVKPGGLFIFSIRVESYDPVEYGFSTKCGELEKEGKCSVVCKQRKQLYSNPNEEKYRDCYVITYKVIKN